MASQVFFETRQFMIVNQIYLIQTQFCYDQGFVLIYASITVDHLLCNHLLNCRIFVHLNIFKNSITCDDDVNSNSKIIM